MEQRPDQRDVLEVAAAAASAYARTFDDRRVFPDEDALAALAAFDEPLPEKGAPPAGTIELLDGVGGPATVASTGSSCSSVTSTAPPPSG